MPQRVLDEMVNLQKSGKQSPTVECAEASFSEGDCFDSCPAKGKMKD